MPYYRVLFTYTCANGHPNLIEKFYLSPNDGEVLTKRFPQRLPCIFCSPDTLLLAESIAVEYEIAWLSDDEFESLGVAVEPEDS
jgi:hypothetical protein